MRSASLRSTPSKLLELTGGGGGLIKEIPAPYAQKNRDDFFWGGFICIYQIYLYIYYVIAACFRREKSLVTKTTLLRESLELVLVHAPCILNAICTVRDWINCHESFTSCSYFRFWLDYILIADSRVSPSDSVWTYSLSVKITTFLPR